MICSNNAGIGHVVDTFLNGQGKIGLHTYGTKRYDNFKVGVCSDLTTVTGIPDALILQNDTVANGETFCFNATQTITVAGNGTTYTLQNVAEVTMIAGQNILFKPNTKIQWGGQLLAKITTNSSFCGTLSGSYLKNNTIIPENNLSNEKKSAFFKVYPNPTNGNFTLEQKSDKQFGNTTVEVYGIRGDKVFTDTMFGEKKHEFSLSQLPAGLYFVRVIADDYAETIKRIKMR